MTAPAPTDRAAARERVLVAAILWVSDQDCSSGLMELEDAVEELLRLTGEARRMKSEESAVGASSSLMAAE